MESYQISLLKTEMKKKIIQISTYYIIYNNIKSITNRCLSLLLRGRRGRIPLFVERENGWGLHFVKLVRYCRKRKIKSHTHKVLIFKKLQVIY